MASPSKQQKRESTFFPKYFIIEYSAETYTFIQDQSIEDFFRKKCLAKFQQ